MAMQAYGVLCRTAFFSNLALGAVSNVTLELTTPYAVNPDGASASLGLLLRSSRLADDEQHAA